MNQAKKTETVINYHIGLLKKSAVALESLFEENQQVINNADETFHESKEGEKFIEKTDDIGVSWADLVEVIINLEDLNRKPAFIS